MSQKMLRDVTAGIPDLIEEAVNALFTHKDYIGIARTENRLEALLQSLVNKYNKYIDEKLRSAKFEDRALRKIERVSSS